jgi:Na+/proline symporter
MNIADWIVMLGTLLGIVAYGIWKTRHVNSVKSYLLGDNDLPWWSIGLSVMATQASAITFLSTPGQGYQDGMQFAQFYFGLPVAMVLLCIFVLPLYYKLKVYTAYEYLESRFGRPTRTFTAILFLISRGLAAGLTIYAPAIILSTILGWSLNYTILFIGILVTVYTVAGGTKAVSVTQTHQMTVILIGMVIAGFILIMKLPSDIGLGEALGVAGKMDKLKVVDFSFDLSNRYTFWSGLLGGVFLFLSYFGTDQSQVSRYLSGKSLTESRLGLIFNGLLKVPMQFLILFTGVLVFLFFQFNPAPLHFNKGNVDQIISPENKQNYAFLEKQQAEIFELRQEEIRNLVEAENQNNITQIQISRDKIKEYLKQDENIREEAKTIILKENPNAKTKDTDYVFITFIIHYLPIGLVGLLLAVIFSAAMSSTASELNALATTTVIDIYKRSINSQGSDRHYLMTSKGMTIMWGAIAMLFAITADLFENLIQAVNIIGSLFYGTILGIFLVAFFFGGKDSKSTGLATIIWAILGGAIALGIGGQNPWLALIGGMLGAITGFIMSKKLFTPVGGNAVFLGALLTEAIVLAIYFLKIDISYLWLNLIGCSLVVLISWFLEMIPKKNSI